MTDFKRVYVDTSPIIYYLENSAAYVEKMKKFFEMCLDNNIQIVTSIITIEEYLVFPYASGKIELVDNFKRFIEYMHIEIINIDTDIAEQAAKIRGKFKSFKAMDSLQIAAAIKRLLFHKNCHILILTKKEPFFTLLFSSIVQSYVRNRCILAHSQTL